MTRPRRAARWRWHADLSDGALLVLGVGAGVVMMLIGWAPTVDVPAPLPAVVSTAALSGPAESDPAKSREAAIEIEPTLRAALEQPARPSASVAEPFRANELSIAKLGITASIDPVGVLDNALVIPDDPARVGRWTGGAKLTDADGAVLLSGHVAWRGRRGALWGLAAADPGTEVRIADSDGRITRWRVVRVWAVVRGTPLPEVFRNTGERKLYIVTCGGRVIEGHFTHNVIAEADPAT